MNNKVMNLIFWAVFFFLLLTSSVIAVTTQYTYDSLNRLIKVQYDDGTVIQYTYDQVGNRLTQQVMGRPQVLAPLPPPARVQVSAPTPIVAAPVPKAPTTPTASMTSTTSTASSAGNASSQPWPALLTRIRLAGSAADLENLREEVRGFLEQDSFSPDERTQYQGLAAQELAARAEYLRRGPAAAGEEDGKENLAVEDREHKPVAAPKHNKIQKDREKIYTSGPEPGSEKPKP